MGQFNAAGNTVKSLSVSDSFQLASFYAGYYKLWNRALSLSVWGSHRSNEIRKASIGSVENATIPRKAVDPFDFDVDWKMLLLQLRTLCQ